MTTLRILALLTTMGAPPALFCATSVAAASRPLAEPALHVSAASAPSARECAVLPRRNLRVRLTSPDEVASVMPAVALQITRLWAAEGVQIQWHDGKGVGGDPWAEVDVWIAMVPELDTAPRGQVLGIVQFDRGIPMRLVRVSIDAVLLWLQRQRRELLDAPDPRLPVIRSAPPPKLAEALAYVGAHELGHYLLASRRHAPNGLMRSVYYHPELLDVPHLWALDARSREVLQGRILQGESCEQRRVAHDRDRNW